MFNMYDFELHITVVVQILQHTYSLRHIFSDTNEAPSNIFTYLLMTLQNEQFDQLDNLRKKSALTPWCLRGVAFTNIFRLKPLMLDENSVNEKYRARRDLQ
jgi:hypothetical protein